MKRPWSMDDNPRTKTDHDDDELPGDTADSGPLGRLVDRDYTAGTFEHSPEALNRPTEPGTASTDYAEGTREHDDDRDE